MHFIWKIWPRVSLIYLDYSALVHIQKVFHNARIVPAAEVIENKCFMWKTITVSKQDATLRLRVLWFFLRQILRKPSPSFLWVMRTASSLYKSPSFKRGSKTTRSIASKVTRLELFKIYYKHSCTNVSAWKKFYPIST